MSDTLTLPAVTDETLPAAIAPGTGLVAVEFTAGWCPPCRVFAPVVEQAARAYVGRLRVVQMDADASPAAMARYGVRSLPTLLAFRDGEPVERVVGAVAPTVLRETLDRLTRG